MRSRQSCCEAEQDGSVPLELQGQVSVTLGGAGQGVGEGGCAAGTGGEGEVGGGTGRGWRVFRSVFMEGSRTVLSSAAQTEPSEFCGWVWGRETGSGCEEGLLSCGVH